MVNKKKILICRGSSVIHLTKTGEEEKDETMNVRSFREENISLSNEHAILQDIPQ